MLCAYGPASEKNKIEYGRERWVLELYISSWKGEGRRMWASRGSGWLLEKVTGLEKKRWKRCDVCDSVFLGVDQVLVSCPVMSHLTQLMKTLGRGLKTRGFLLEKLFLWFFCFLFFLTFSFVLGYILAWRIPWTEEPGRLQSMGSRRVRHDWVTSLSLYTFMHWRRKWQPTPVFLPGESQGQRGLVGCRLWGHTESDTTEAT